MRTVFADSFYFVARLNRNDQHRERVREFLQGFEANLITTDWVLMEVADALSASIDRNRLRDFILDLRTSSQCEVIDATRELFDRALTFFHRHADKQWSLTDCTSFVVMRERGLKEALTGDKHFEQAGFVPLLK